MPISLTGSLNISGSNTLIGTKTITGSVFISGSKTIVGDNTITGSLIVSGSQTFIGTKTITGSVFISGSKTVIGTNTITGSMLISGSLTTTGTITATTLVVQTITSSISSITGSTNFGSLSSNTHKFTGSVLMSGSLGIGISNPQFKYHQYGGKFILNSDDSSYGQMQIGNTTTGTEATIIFAGGSGSFGSTVTSGDGNTAIWAIGSSTYGLGVSKFGIANVAYGSNILTVSSSGNVGINITSPTNVLHLVGGSATPSLRLGSTSATFYWDIGRENATTGDFIFINANPGSPTERFRITTDGKVGIGTTAPTSPLTVRSTSRGDMLRLSISGSSAVSDATGITFGSATYDKAQIIAYNENTGNAAGYLTFWTGGSPATTDMTERMRIKSDGRVYVGGTSISNSPLFGVIGSGIWDGGCIGLSNTGAGGQAYTIFSTSNAFSQGAGNLLFYNINTPSNVLIINSNGNYDFLGSDVSDRRLKQDIENVNFGLNEIMQLSPKSYHLKSQDNLSGENVTTLRKRYGFIAQEVQPILPDTITGTETETEYLGLDYNGVLAVAVKAIQELTARVQYLENK